MNRIVIVTKLTRLEELILKHFSEETVAFILETSEQSIDVYKEEDRAYKEALDLIRQQIPADLACTSIERKDLPTFVFRDDDFIIACGPDGLFVNLAQYVTTQTVLTVNPDKKTVAGVLMLFDPSEVGSVLTKVLADEAEYEELPFIKASIGVDKILWAINDIFIGRKDHVSARYRINYAGRSEAQSSSGIIISSGVGSSGWLKSIQVMVEAISGRNSHRLSSTPAPSDKELVFVVREPFPMPNTGTSIITGRIRPGMPLTVNSEMPNGGCVFSDGITERTISWNAGDIVQISVGERFIKRIIK